MKHFLFINQDKKAIKKLLFEIGKHDYELALQNMQIKDPPFSMEGFYLEANNNCIFLAYRYPSRVVVNIMKVEKYTYIPIDGWKLVKEQAF